MTDRIVNGYSADRINIRRFVYGTWGKRLKAGLREFADATPGLTDGERAALRKTATDGDIPIGDDLSGAAAVFLAASRLGARAFRRCRDHVDSPPPPGCGCLEAADLWDPVCDGIDERMQLMSWRARFATAASETRRRVGEAERRAARDALADRIVVASVGADGVKPASDEERDDVIRAVLG